MGWLQRSSQFDSGISDLTSLGFFLWGLLMPAVFVNCPCTMADLRENISAACAAITPLTFACVRACVCVCARARVGGGCARASYPCVQTAGGTQFEHYFQL
jgi:hypothetical protein